MARRALAVALLPVLLLLHSPGHAERMDARVARLASQPRRRPRRLASVPGLGAMVLLAAAPMTHGMTFFELEAIDDNRDGMVDKVEFMYAVRDVLDSEGKRDKMLRTARFRRAEDLYDLVDINEDEMLGHLELQYAEYITNSIGLLASAAGEDPSEYGFDGKSPNLLESLDVDGDGAIDEDEYWDAVKSDFLSWGWSDRKVSQPWIRQWTASAFQEADRDGDGLIDVNEVHFAGFLVYQKAVWELSGVMLHGLDLNRNGKLEWTELADRLAREGNKRPPGIKTGKTVMEHLADRWEASDLDGDVMLGREELRRFYADLLLRVQYETVY